jgi:hypothetical protein
MVTQADVEGTYENGIQDFEIKEVPINFKEV